MHPHLSFVSLPVLDLAAARQFLGDLGLEPHPRSPPGTCFFQLEGQVLALVDHPTFARVVGCPPGAPGGCLLSHNLPDVPALDALFARALSLGARVTAAPGWTPFGVYRACFADPEGHLWELAVNPRHPVHPQLGFRLSPPKEAGEPSGG